MTRMRIIRAAFLLALTAACTAGPAAESSAPASSVTATQRASEAPAPSIATTTPSATPSTKLSPTLGFPRPIGADNNVRCGILTENPIKTGEGSGAYLLRPATSAAWGVTPSFLVGLPDRDVPAYGTYVCVRAIPGAPMASFARWIRSSEPDYIPASALTPTGFTLPPGCAYVGTPTTDARDEQVVWKVTCGASADRDARGTLAPALAQQGWKSCESGLAAASWAKDGRTLGIAESSGAPGDHPTLSLRPTSSCP